MTPAEDASRSSATSLPRVAFVGLGIMGASMAGHLLAAGYPLTVHSRTRSKAEPLLAHGARWADSAAEAAAGADVFLMCVTDTPHVQAVLFEKDGAIGKLKPGAIVIDHSTISPSHTRAMAVRLAAAGVTMLDAPVSGGDLGARNATLSIMVGGDEAAFQRVEPVFRTMGKTITHCGPSGTGQLTKLVNQVLVTVTNLAVCEALTLAQQGGLDPAKTIAAIGGGAAGSWQLNNLGPKMIAGDFAPGFSIDLQMKDLRLVQETLSDHRLNLPASAVVRELYAAAQSQGRGGEGTQAMFAVVKDAATKA